MGILVDNSDQFQVQTSVTKTAIAGNSTANETSSNITEAMKVKRDHELVHTPNILGMISYKYCFPITAMYTEQYAICRLKSYL